MTVEKLSPPPLSYVLSEESVNFDFGNSFKTIILPDGRNFFFHDQLPVSVGENKETGGYVLIAGLVIDLNINSADLRNICQSLVDALLLNERYFLDRTDNLSGRFIVIYKKSSQESPYIIGDATNMLKINYSKKYKLCSSNIFLINHISNDGRKDYRSIFNEHRKLWKYGALGDCTPLNDISILTPNHRINLNTYDLDRFYPREVVQTESNVCMVAGAVFDMCSRQHDILADKYSLRYSLTAGVDSRFSLAIAKSKKKNQSYFTYLYSDAHEVDAKVASHIAKKMSLNHKVVALNDQKYRDILNGISSPISFYDKDLELEGEIKKWDWYNHGIQLVSPYRQLLSNESDTLPDLHIRSNLYEIGRAFWGKKGGPCDDSKKILESSRKDWASECSVIFEDYFDRNQINADSVYGLDLLDIFYWEHRCGTWVSEVLQSTDFAFNTHAYVNCRKIIEKLLSLNIENRKNATLFKAIIAGNLPEIESIPINPKTY